MKTLDMKTFIVDSFTDRVFRGNPAGVCIVEAELGDALMLSIAQELNLSETAFIRRLGESNAFSIRYFSPKMEIPLCGHATLASARVAHRLFSLNAVRFTTGGGVALAATSTDESIQMHFPVYETVAATVPDAMLHALGLHDVVNCAYNQELRILLLEIASAEVLKRLVPDYAALLKTHDAIHGVLVTAASSGDGYDFHSRYFWPWSGTNEDPVTGGTHTFLAKYWSQKLGRTTLQSFQSSKRSGFMEVALQGDTVAIRSQAVIVLEGSLSLPKNA